MIIFCAPIIAAKIPENVDVDVFNKAMWVHSSLLCVLALCKHWVRAASGLLHLGLLGLLDLLLSFYSQVQLVSPWAEVVVWVQDGILVCAWLGICIEFQSSILTTAP